MDILLYRATSFARAMDVTAPIQEQHQKENSLKYWSKTTNRILWALEKFGDAGATPKGIAEAIDRNVQTVKQRLAHLCKTGQVDKIGRGLYRRAVGQESEALPVPSHAPKPIPESLPVPSHDVVPVRESLPVPSHEPERITENQADAMEVEDNATPNLDYLFHPETLPDDVFMRSMLALDDKDKAEQKIIDRFYRQAKEFASGRSRCPKHYDYQLAKFRAAWSEGHHGGDDASVEANAATE